MANDIADNNSSRLNASDRGVNNTTTTTTASTTTTTSFDGADEIDLNEGDRILSINSEADDDKKIDNTEEQTNTTTITTPKPTPLPKSFFIICIVLFSESFVASMLFPYVAFMVRDFHVAADDTQIGYYSGVLASSFFLGQFVSGFMWGWMSDRYGRRPILMIGMIGSAISVFGFGWSFSYAWAIACRSFGGFMNSNFSIARSWIGDMTDPSNRVRGFSMVGLMWGAGGIVGPTMGGLLSNPADNLTFLNLTPDSFLNKHPYIMPSFVGAFISLLAVTITFFFLPESNKFVGGKKLAAEVEMSAIAVVDGGDDSDTTSITDEPLLEAKGSEKKTTKTRVDDEAEEDEYNFDDVDVVVKENVVVGVVERMKRKIWKQKTAKDYVQMRKEKSLLETQKKPGISIVFKSRPVLTTAILICIQGSSVVGIDDLFPLWAMAAPPAGLGFTSKDIGIAWSIGGVSMLLFQAFIYTHLIKRISPLGGVRYGSFFFAFVFLSYPLLSYLANTNWVWVGLGVVLAGRYVAGSTSGTTLNLILNTVGGPEVQKHRGVVNGFSMSLRGAAMACSPFLASSVFAWSVGNGLSFPFNHFFEFIILALCALTVSLGSFFIPANET